MPEIHYSGNLENYVKSLLKILKGVEILELRGLCAICGLPAKLYTCPLCGKTVCIQCMDHKKHICVRCANGRAGITPGSDDLRTFK
jgi:hypothetical protein